MSQSDLDSIAKKLKRVSLIILVKGGKPPTPAYVIDLQRRWKLFSERQDVTRLENQTVMGQNCVVLKHMKSGLFVSFTDSTGESFTGYQLTEKQSIIHDKTGIIGKDYLKN